jgi:hypothetical protein
MIRRLPRRLLTAFTGPDGEVRELRDPYAPATPRQLRRLNELGLLELVEHAETILVGEAAAALSEALAGEDGDAPAADDDEGSDSASLSRKWGAGGFA